MESKTNAEREVEIYSQYQLIIAPFIAELEVRDAEYPIEVFNEIRAVFTHLSRYKLQGAEPDLLAAEKHVKRAILDCFKYMCISIAEEIKLFRVSYKKVDLKLADNGLFLPELDRREYVAKTAYKRAKIAEIKKQVNGKSLNEDQLYKLFEDAYNAYKNLSELLEESQEAVLFASSHSKTSNMISIISIIVTIASIAVAIVCAI